MLKLKTDERPTLQDVLSEHTVVGELWKTLQEDRLECFACGHRCVIKEGRIGICKVRFNRDGKLYVPRGYAGGIQLDPIEKKPFFHAYPGTSALSFGMLGCDFHCSYCQNWITSQALRDPLAVTQPVFLEAEALVRMAKKHKARVLTSTYNEPLITSEWAVEVFRKGKEEGLVGSYVSNGNATPEVLDYIRPYVDLYKVDLKSFDDRGYRQLGGTLKTVLRAIEMLVEKGFWLEVVTLVIPTFNDSEQELNRIAHFLAGVSKDIPWHITAFHKDYKMCDPENTPVSTLIRAAEIGREAGLNFVYAGNVPGEVGKWENTYCPNCQALLVERYGFHVLRNLIRAGNCPECDFHIPGVWE